MRTTETNDDNYVHVEGTAPEPTFGTFRFITENKGWECPKCGKCWAPTVQGCTTCNMGIVPVLPYVPWIPPVDAYPPLPQPTIITDKTNQIPGVDDIVVNRVVREPGLITSHV